jgi:hypothetical protein
MDARPVEWAISEDMVPRLPGQDYSQITRKPTS